MNYKRIFIVANLFVCLSGNALFAQLRVPSMDIQVKSGMTLIDEMRNQYDFSYEYLAFSLQGEINLNISQYVAAGVFVSNGVYSPSQVRFESYTGTTFYNASHRLYGLKLRLSSGRQPRFRPFAELNYGHFEMYIEKNGYRAASSSPFFGGSLGLMIRLNNKFYLILPQITVRQRSDPFFFEVSSDFAFGKYSPMIEVTGGISYNFGKKK